MSKELQGRHQVFIGPGELHCGNRDTRIRTLLGSCVSVTLWHSKKQIGAMCHYMLPSRRTNRGGHSPLDGRYADEALLLLCGQLEAAGVNPNECEAKIFGAGNMFTTSRHRKAIDIPRRNAEVGLDLLTQRGIPILARDLGGFGYRNVIFDIANGSVWVNKLRESCCDQEIFKALLPDFQRTKIGKWISGP